MRPRMCVVAGLGVVGCLLSATPTASAALVQMTMQGAITSSNMGPFPVGQAITIVWTYESTGSPQFIANRQAFYVDHFRSISVTSGAWSVSDSGAFGQINKYDNLSNFDGIQFQVAAVPATYQFTNPKPDTVSFANAPNGDVFGNMFINYVSNSSSVWSEYTLPESYNFAAFDQTINFNFGFGNGGFSGGFTFMEATIVPAPTSAVALAVLMGAGAVRRRRRG